MNKDDCRIFHIDYSVSSMRLFHIHYMYNTMSSNVRIFTEGIHNFLSIVGSLMASKSRTLTEGFPTQMTSIRFLSSMSSLMSSKGRTFTEGFPT